MSLCWSEVRPGPLAPLRFSRRLAGWCAAAIGLLAPVAVAKVRLGIVCGGSMEPTLRSGQPFLFRRCTTAPGTLQRGDLVVVRMGGVTCIKRVYALGQDRFWSVTPAGRPDEQTSLLAVGDPLLLWKRRFPRFAYVERQVPDDCVFVVGDSVSASIDSRQLGPVPVSQVVGRVVWPRVPYAPPGGPIAYWSDQPRHPRSKSRSSLVPNARRTEAVLAEQRSLQAAHAPGQLSL